MPWPNWMPVARPALGASETVPMRGALPRGLTLLAVEDSRFAAEALRLMCRRLGLHLRRAEDLRQAYRHLGLYAPDAVLIDLGLPDGRGEALIRALAASRWRPRAVLATSGDPAGREAALAAGADAFLAKPLESLAAFRAPLLRLLPELAYLPAAATDPPLAPDPLALHDDLARAAEVLHERADDPEGRRYLAGFLGGVARHAHDPALAEAAEAAGRSAPDAPADRLETLLERRLAAPDGAFPDQARRRR